MLMAAGCATVACALAVETEEVDPSEWAAIEAAMAMVGAVKNATGNATGNAMGNATGAGEGVVDLEDCVGTAGAGDRRAKRRRSRDASELTPLELCASRGRPFVFVTEICSQVCAPVQELRAQGRARPRHGCRVPQWRELLARVVEERRGPAGLVRDAARLHAAEKQGAPA